MMIKWSRIDQKLVKKLPKNVKYNGPKKVKKWCKNVQKWPKMAKNGQKKYNKIYNKMLKKGRSKNGVRLVKNGQNMVQKWSNDGE